MQQTQHRNNTAPLWALVAQGATVDVSTFRLSFNAAVDVHPAEVWVSGWSKFDAGTRLRFDAQGRLLNPTPVQVRREAVELLATLGLQFDAS